MGRAGYVNAVSVGAVAGGCDVEALGMEVGAAHHTNVEEHAVHRFDPFNDGVGHPQENQTLHITRSQFNHNLICEDTKNLRLRIWDLGAYVYIYGDVQWEELCIWSFGDSYYGAMQRRLGRQRCRHR